MLGRRKHTSVFSDRLNGQIKHTYRKDHKKTLLNLASMWVYHFVYGRNYIADLT